jgi:hypothetical protein
VLPFVITRTHEICVEDVRLGPPVSGGSLVTWREKGGKFGVEGVVADRGGDPRRYGRWGVPGRPWSGWIAPLRLGGFVSFFLEEPDRASLVMERHVALGDGAGHRSVIARIDETLRTVDAAQAANGESIVVWHVWQSVDDGGNADGPIYGRRFDAAGRPLGASFMVSSAAGALLGVANNAAGQFVITWISGGQGQMRTYAAGGAPQSPVVPIGSEVDPGVSAIPFSRPALDARGNVLVLWLRVAYTRDTLLAQLFDSQGRQLGPAVVVADIPEGFLLPGGAASLHDGLWAVTWGQYDSQGTRLLLRRFAS